MNLAQSANAHADDWKAGCSAEYLAAIDAHNAAFAVYSEVRDDFRTGRVDRDTYLAARAIFFAANQAFDLVYAAEARRA